MYPTGRTLVAGALALAVAAGAGCALGPDEVVPASDDVAQGDPIEGSAMNGYSWVIDGELAGMPRPGARRALDEDLAFLEEQGLDLLVSLTEEGTDPVAAARRGIDVLHLPVKDFTAPTMLQLREFVVAANAAIAAGKQVGVHCGAGKGRTGTFLSTFFVDQGMTADEAIAHVRSLRPGSVETATQVEVIREYAVWSRDVAPTGVAP
jgi:atypical dual specificity phosphatase